MSVPSSRADLAEQHAHPKKPDELSSLLRKIAQNDAPRWMVVKDNIDHGPFSAREVIQMMSKGEIHADHGLTNLDTRERRPLRDYAEFAGFLEYYRQRRRESEETAALTRSTRSETFTKWGVWVIGGLVLLGVGGAATKYILSRKQSQDEAKASDLADLYERGEVRLSGTADVLPSRRRGGGHRRGSRTGAQGASYEEAMNEAVDLGDVTQGGDQRQLTPGDVAQVMNRNLRSLYRCVGQELRTGNQLGKVRLDLAILGSGQVQGVSVRTGSAAFQACIAGQAKSIRFPSFPAPRMGASFSFQVDGP